MLLHGNLEQGFFQELSTLGTKIRHGTWAFALTCAVFGPLRELELAAAVHENNPHLERHEDTYYSTADESFKGIQGTM